MQIHALSNTSSKCEMQSRQCNSYPSLYHDVTYMLGVTVYFSAYKPGKDEVDQFIATMKPSEDSKSESSEYEDYWDSYEVQYQPFYLKRRAHGTTSIAIAAKNGF